MGWQLCRGISGSFRLESVAGLLWNQWQLSCGTGGSFAVESVAGFTWNRWQLWRGIRTGIRQQRHTVSEHVPIDTHHGALPITPFANEEEDQGVAVMSDQRVAKHPEEIFHLGFILAACRG